MHMCTWICECAGVVYVCVVVNTWFGRKCMYVRLKCHIITISTGQHNIWKRLRTQRPSSSVSTLTGWALAVCLKYRILSGKPSGRNQRPGGAAWNCRFRDFPLLSDTHHCWIIWLCLFQNSAFSTTEGTVTLWTYLHKDNACMGLSHSLLGKQALIISLPPLSSSFPLPPHAILCII